MNSPQDFTHCDEHGKRFFKTCGPGTVFDPVTKVCVWPDSVTTDCYCDASIVPPSTTTVAPTENDEPLVLDDCLDCICQVETECNENFGCQGGYCGPYRISHAYYIDCEVDGGGYEACTNNKTCSEACIQNYMKRYAQSCVGDFRKPTCQDFARIHRYGINGCNDPSSLGYWDKVNQCLGGGEIQPVVDPICYECICLHETNCNLTIGCLADGHCGPYHISQAYYIDCGVDGGGYYNCVNDKTCAEKCIEQYVLRYGSYCSEHSSPTCQEIALLHKGGPFGCKNNQVAFNFSMAVDQCFVENNANSKETLSIFFLLKVFHYLFA